MDRRVRLIIDGCGTLTTETILPHLVQEDFRQIAEVVAVADIVPERAEAAARAFDVPNWRPSLDQALEEVEADGVLVIVPHALHAEHALNAIRSGRHVYVQKPLAPDLSSAREVCRAAREKGVKVAAAPGQCLWPLYRQIRDVIEQGEVGPAYVAIPPLMGWGGMDVGFPSDPSWFFGPEAGPLRDHGGYGFQTLVSIFGPAQRVSAFSATRTPSRRWRGAEFEVAGHENTAVMLDFGEGLFSLLPEAWCDTASAARVLRIHALDGSIQTHPETFNHLDILPLSATVVRMGRLPLTLAVDVERTPMMAGRHPFLGHTHVYGDILHWVECIRSGEDPANSALLGAHFVDMVEASFRSAASGTAQQLDPDLARAAGTRGGQWP